MATLSKPEFEGYKYDFIDQISEDYFCMLCKHVAREPNITTCCGECFCEACIQDKKPCPNCSKTDFTSILHPKYHAKIQALEVRCTMKDRGCPWTGQLQHLDAHLDVTTGDCQYVDVECPKKCVQKVQKRNVDTHLANECPNRDYRCPHCNFANKFHVVSDHFDVCPYYPLACPNRCGATFERDDLPDHMKMCRLEEVQCVFSDAGCQAKFIRENEDEHMNQNTQKHLTMMPAATLRISQDFKRKLQEQQDMFRKKLEQQKEEHEHLGGQLQQNNKQIKQVVQKLDKQSREIEKLREQQNDYQDHLKKKDVQIKALEEIIRQICSGEVGIPPYDITLSNYKEDKAKDGSTDSPPMYTHPMGSRFTLRLRPNGSTTEGRGTHVSVSVYSLKGYHDSELKFPVKFTITVQLLNQHRDQDHYTRDIQCEINSIGMIGWPIGSDRTFIPHAALEWNRDKQTQYLKDDCLRFRLTKVIVH